MYNSIYQIKQHMIMNINFAIYFRVITVLNCFGDDQRLGLKLVSDELNCFGDDQCLGLKSVSDEVNQVFPLLF